MSNQALPIASKDVKTGEIIIYPSICHAVRAGFSSGSIYRCRSGGAQTHGGQRWAVADCAEAAARIFDAQEAAYAAELLRRREVSIKDIFHYDPATGIFTRLDTPGEPAGRLHKDGYRWLKIGEKEYSAHRAAWFYMTGEKPSGDIDHINGVRDDNRFENLRVCESPTMNMGNRPISQRNTSGAKGVARELSGRYRARLYFKGKVHTAGLFDTLDEAAHAYNKMAIEHFGEFAVLNPIGIPKEMQSNV